MKIKSLVIIIASLALMMASGCKKEAKPGQLESIKFKQASYTIAENYRDLNLRKELETVPEGIKDTAKISYAVSDESVAEMNGSFLEPKRDGDVTVTATVQGKSATCNVQITLVPLEDFSLEDFSVHVNGTAKALLTTVPSGINHERFAWKLSNTSYATIDKSGVVTGLKEGTVTVTATAGDKSKTCTLTIEKVSVDKITLSKSSIEFTEIGSTEQLTATITPPEAAYHKITWKSSNTSVATVENGFVVCKGPGTAEITAKADGQEAKCTVNLQKIYATSIKLNSNKDILYIANLTKATLTTEVTPSNANEILQWNVITGISGYSGNATIETSSTSRSATVTPTQAGLIQIKASGEKSGVNDVYKLKIVEEFGSVTDRCNNTYRTVKIGNQWWMAENLRCHIYDTESELSGHSNLKNASTFSKQYDKWFDPYYFYDSNSTELKDWSDYNKRRVGYLYNWAAATAISTGDLAKKVKSDFAYKRQGICPNGWHLPKKSEWEALYSYANGVPSSIMSDSGWYDSNGEDKYGFYSLPVGLFSINNRNYSSTGYYSYFWESTGLSAENSSSSLVVNKNGTGYAWVTSYSVAKNMALSVRCVKN